ncbi:hypothetical protein Ciccas_011154 [Cichlidogyrus casuarinus]|uniref:Uncharacterized protein n=1 Tax=Cichlidogyrus casuarinus TaxID=1844966 RepID=A0ABD2PSR1_9PLAT
MPAFQSDTDDSEPETGDTKESSLRFLNPCTDLLPFSSEARHFESKVWQSIKSKLTELLLRGDYLLEMYMLIGIIKEETKVAIDLTEDERGALVELLFSIGTSLTVDHMTALLAMDTAASLCKRDKRRLSLNMPENMKVYVNLVRSAFVPFPFMSD